MPPSNVPGTYYCLGNSTATHIVGAALRTLLSRLFVVRTVISILTHPLIIPVERIPDSFRIIGVNLHAPRARSAQTLALQGDILVCTK